MSIVDKLRRVTDRGVILDFVPGEMDRHLRDVIAIAPAGHVPIAIAYPRSTSEVSAILRTCDDERVAVIPQGGLTGHSGGAVPDHGSLVLSLDRMNAIEEVDRRGFTMTVQSGVILQTIQSAAAEAGLMFGLDIGGRGSCQIGGNISTNAGGNQVIRYGTMKHLVLGLEAVLADGTVLSSMTKMLKNSAGYDLKQLFMGSEGTLGVITRAVLRLHPRMKAAATVLCALRDFPALEEFMANCRQGLGDSLNSFEVMWSPFYSLVTAGLGRQAPLAPDAGIYVIVEATGNNEELLRGELEALVAHEIESTRMSDAVVAQSEQQRADIWRLRESTGEIIRKLGGVIPFDISLPTASIGAFVAQSEKVLLARWPGCTALFFGHLGDSNLHLAFRAASEPQPTHEADCLIYGLVREFGGSISGEHGVGILKRDFLNHSRSDAEIQVMRRLKRALDPHNTLNPGKIFPLVT